MSRPAICVFVRVHRQLRDQDPFDWRAGGNFVALTRAATCLATVLFLVWGHSLRTKWHVALCAVEAVACRQCRPFRRRHCLCSVQRHCSALWHFEVSAWLACSRDQPSVQWRTWSPAQLLPKGLSRLVAPAPLPIADQPTPGAFASGRRSGCDCFTDAVALMTAGSLSASLLVAPSIPLKSLRM